MEISSQTSFIDLLSDLSFGEGLEFLDQETTRSPFISENTKSNESRFLTFVQKTKLVFSETKLFQSPLKISIFSYSRPSQLLEKVVYVIHNPKESLKFPFLKKIENFRNSFFPQKIEKVTPTLPNPASTTLPKNNRSSPTALKNPKIASPHSRQGEGNVSSSSSEKSKEEEKSWEKKEQGEHEKKRDDRDSHSEDDSRRFLIKEIARKEKKTSAQESASIKLKKPTLAPPKMGVFALYHVLNKEGIRSNSHSAMETKQEIEHVNELTESTHKKRLEELRKSLESEKSVYRWGVAVKMYSWIATSLTILSGVVLVTSGAGTLAGTILLASGVIALSNQLLEEFGGWKKIAEKLPYDDPEKKRTTILWIQIGVTAFCLVLSAAAFFFGGYATVGGSFESARMLLTAFVNIGSGVSTIGQGITSSIQQDRIGNVKMHQMKLAELKHRRQNLMENMESGIDRLKNLYENLASLLGFYDEMFQAEQKIYR